MLVLSLVPLLSCCFLSTLTILSCYKWTVTVTITRLLVTVLLQVIRTRSTSEVLRILYAVCGVCAYSTVCACWQIFTYIIFVNEFNFLDSYSLHWWSYSS